MFFGARLPTSLINPNQVRATGHVVDECPKQFDKESRHGIVTSCGLEINLEMNGVISFIPMRKPTDKEIAECTRVEMTSAMRWDPHSQSFEKAEENALDKAGDIMCVESNNNSSIKIKLNSYPYITGGAEAQMERSVMSNNTRMVSLVMMDPGGNFDLFLDEYSLEVNDNLLGLKDSVSFSNGESSIRHCCEKSSGSVIGECCEECVGLERELSAVATTNRKCVVSPSVLGHRWGGWNSHCI